MSAQTSLISSLVTALARATDVISSQSDSLVELQEDLEESQGRELTRDDEKRAAAREVWFLDLALRYNKLHRLAQAVCAREEAAQVDADHPVGQLLIWLSANGEIDCEDRPPSDNPFAFKPFDTFVNVSDPAAQVIAGHGGSAPAPGRGGGGGGKSFRIFGVGSCGGSDSYGDIPGTPVGDDK